MGCFASCQPDFTILNEHGELYARMGQPLPDKYPLYGCDAHRTRAGIHADGLNKFWWMYAPFDVPKLIGRPLEVSLTKQRLGNCRLNLRSTPASSPGVQ
jgi:isopropylmalate/homocitrate/citramalate synthase